MDPNLRIIDAHNRMIALVDDRLSRPDQKEAYGQLTKTQQAEYKKAHADWNTALLDGACMIFGISHERKAAGRAKGDAFFSRVSMRKGPGDIQKGSFKKE